MTLSRARLASGSCKSTDRRGAGRKNAWELCIFPLGSFFLEVFFFFFFGGGSVIECYRVVIVFFFFWGGGGDKHSCFKGFFMMFRG